MKISEESLRGYIIEEILAYLIRNTGYELLVDKEQDPRELDRMGHGLVVKGRGAVHQVDVLGELKWIPAFTYPLRLIVEAKFRKEKTGIDVVRNAVSVLLDVNQNESPIREQNTFFPKYQYVYAIFSTSGFSRPAIDMAIAHKISLIDLSGNEYELLKKAIKESAKNILLQAKNILMQEENIQGENQIRRGQLVSNLRYYIRKELNILPPIDDLYLQFDKNLENILSKNLKTALNVAREYGELFVGMSKGPFMLLLKADNPEKFLEYSKNNPSHRVNITWSFSEDNGKIWKVEPVLNENTYELSFKLPNKLYEWVFEVEKNKKKIFNRALNVKRSYFSSITIYRYEDERDYLFRLKFDPEKIKTDF